MGQSLTIAPPHIIHYTHWISLLVAASVEVAAVTVVVAVAVVAVTVVVVVVAAVIVHQSMELVLVRQWIVLIGHTC